MLRLIAEILATAMALSLGSCANTVYRWNLDHAEIASGTNLSEDEVEQVIRTVTKKSLRLILGITRSQEEGRDRVIVYTDEGPEEGGMMVYHLEKSSDGLWRIVKYGRRNVMVM
jgi:hypothetical protein